MPDPLYNPRLIVLAGQSNAIGVAEGAELQEDLIEPIAGAKILYGEGIGTDWSQTSWQTLEYNKNNEGVDGKLTPGYHGHFSIELRLMKSLVAAYGEFNLLKVGKGGTSLNQDANDDWSPLSTGEYFDISNGYETYGVNSLGGFAPACYIWIQGENDVYPPEYGQKYRQHLTEFIALKRARFGYEVPFIICRLGNLQTQYTTDFKYLHDVVRGAQEYVAANVPNCYLVSMDGLETQDGVHYNAASMNIAALRVLDAVKLILDTHEVQPPAVTKKVVSPKILIAKQVVSFAEIGINNRNTAIIKKITPTGIENYIPNSATNQINGTEVNATYLIIPTDEVELSEDDFKIGS